MMTLTASSFSARPFSTSQFSAGRFRSPIFVSIAAIMSLLLVGGCTPTKVESQYDPKADFKSLKTYAIKPNKQPIITIRILMGRPLAETIDASIAREMDKRGFKQVKPEEADIIVRWVASLQYTSGKAQSGPTVQDLNMALSSGDDIYGMGSSGWAGETPMSSAEGGILIDMVQPKTKHILWRGSVESIVKEDLPDPKRVQRLNNALDKLFANFPPK